MAQDGYVFTIAMVFFAKKTAAESWTDPQDLKIFGGHRHTTNMFGFIGRREVKAHVCVAGNVFERLPVLAQMI